MKKAIYVLQKRIKLLNKEITLMEKRTENAEMVCELDWAQNDITNWENEIEELQKAIEILSVKNW